MRAKLISFVIVGATRPKKAKEAVQSPIVKALLTREALDALHVSSEKRITIA